MKKQYPLALMTLLLTIALIGCSRENVSESSPNTTLTQIPQEQVTTTIIPENKEEPSPFQFSTSPENTIEIAYIDDIINNYDEYKSMYYDYISYQMTQIMTEDLDTFLIKLKNEKGEKEVTRFSANANNLRLVYTLLLEEETRMGHINEIAAQATYIIQNYLKCSRLGDKESVSFLLSKEMENADPIGKVQSYMKDNDIVITNIDFSDSVVDIDFSIAPTKFTYQYIIKGISKGSPFEKEVAQDFYISLDLPSEDFYIPQFFNTIECIKDTPMEQ